MILQETYNPEQVLDDVFFPITSTLDDPNKKVKRKKKWWAEDSAVTRVDLADVSSEFDPLIPTCHVDLNAAPFVGTRKEQPVVTEVRKDHDYYAIKARQRIMEIYDFDRRTWGLVYGAMDIWSHFKHFVKLVSGEVNDIRHRAGARVRGYFSRKR